MTAMVVLGKPGTVDDCIAALQDYLAANPTSVSSNAAAFIKNITGAQGLTQRTTNATLSYVVPSGQKVCMLTRWITACSR